MARRWKSFRFYVLKFISHHWRTVFLIHISNFLQLFTLLGIFFGINVGFICFSALLILLIHSLTILSLIFQASLFILNSQFHKVSKSNTLLLFKKHLHMIFNSWKIACRVYEKTFATSYTFPLNIFFYYVADVTWNKKILKFLML